MLQTLSLSLDALGDLLPRGLLPGLLTLCAIVVLFPLLPRDNKVARLLVSLVTIALIGRYIFWRLLSTFPTPAFTLNFVLAFVFILVESFEKLRAILQAACLSRSRDRTAEVDANLPWLATLSPAPLVNVLICTCNEEEAILERTIVGALAMTYPNFRVWVLDDGQRAWLRDLCQQSGCGYITRPDNAHAKAGNINNALQHLARLDLKPDYIGILDADFVCTPSFLTRSMALFHDRDVALVQTPQHFYNNDPIQMNLHLDREWPDEQRLFFDVVQPAWDAWGVAMCCGTSSVMRASALAEIGGFPTDSVTEDFHLSLRLREFGYETVYLNEQLTAGMSPEGVKEYVTQRSRWCLGLMQIMRGPSGPFSRNKLPLLQRLCLIQSFLGWTSANAYRLLGIWAPPFFLLFGLRMFSADIEQLTAMFLPAFFWECAMMSWLSAGRSLPILSEAMGWLGASSVLKASFVGLVWPKDQRFKVTAKGGDRTRGFIEWPLMRFFLFAMGVTLLGMFAYEIQNSADPDGSRFVAYAWSWYNVIVLAIACFVCVEKPRYRRTERFDATGEVITLSFDERKVSRGLIDISITGAGVSGPAPAPIGTITSLELDGLIMRARIVRIASDRFAIAFESTFVCRAKMIQKLHSGRYTRVFRKVDSQLVARRVLRRILG